MRNDPVKMWDVVPGLLAARANGQSPVVLPEIEDGADLCSKPAILPPDVIEGLLHRGSKMVLGGASKSFKTWTLLDLAIAVATGAPWLGFPTQRGRVLYVNLELQSGFFSKRIQTICDLNQLSLEPSYLAVWNLRGYAADLSTLLPHLLQKIERDHYALQILDPIYKLLGARDENKAGDVASLLNETERMAVETGAAVAFGAHYSKGNQSQKESIDRIGGSGVFARDPDSILNFTRHDEEDCFRVDATLRNHPPIKPFCVRWEFPTMAIDPNLDPARLKKPGPAGITPAELLPLIAKPMTATEIVHMAKGELNCERARVYELLRELTKSGKLAHEPRGKYEPEVH